MKVAPLCLTFCDPVDYTVHGILQASILEWVAFPFSRGSSQPRDRTQVSLIAGEFFTISTTCEAPQRTIYCIVLLLVAQSYPTLCNPMDCSPPDYTERAPLHSPGKNTGVGSHAFLQGIFPAQGLNPGLPLRRQSLYHLSHKGGSHINDYTEQNPPITYEPVLDGNVQTHSSLVLFVTEITDAD